ncbi:hypothetical protein [Pontimonas sp.]|jgi:hypothetical protein|nr:hypothetical protein [Pontimonas sp.]MDR9396249.1 hypothetical protein [Pontimonas sp.]MDR9434666.1 hypothetical protein [Pontimonas sp.]
MSDALPDELWPDDDSRPIRSHRKKRVLRTVALVGLGLLVLPGLLGSLGQANRSAAYACEIARQYYAPNAPGVDARFALLPLSAAGWQCYVPVGGEQELLIATLGPIPGFPNLRPVTGT